MEQLNLTTIYSKMVRDTTLMSDSSSPIILTGAHPGVFNPRSNRNKYFNGAAFPVRRNYIHLSGIKIHSAFYILETYALHFFRRVKSHSIVKYRKEDVF